MIQSSKIFQKYICLESITNQTKTGHSSLYYLGTVFNISGFVYTTTLSFLDKFGTKPGSA